MSVCRYFDISNFLLFLCHLLIHFEQLRHTFAFRHLRRKTVRRHHGTVVVLMNLNILFFSFCCFNNLPYFCATNIGCVRLYGLGCPRLERVVRSDSSFSSLRQYLHSQHPVAGNIYVLLYYVVCNRLVMTIHSNSLFYRCRCVV